MENTAQSSRPDARVIHLRFTETPVTANQHETHQPVVMDLHTLQYIDQLLDEHFK